MERSRDPDYRVGGFFLLVGGQFHDEGEMVGIALAGKKFIAIRVAFLVSDRTFRHDGKAREFPANSIIKQGRIEKMVDILPYALIVIGPGRS